MPERERRVGARLSKRLPVKLNTDIYPESVKATTGNITGGGMLIEFPPEEKLFDSMLRNKSLLLELDLYGEGGKFNPLSEICWHRKEEKNGIYNVGVKFIKMTPVQKRIISMYITRETVKTFPADIQDRIPGYIVHSPEITISRLKKIIGEIMLLIAGAYVRRQRVFAGELDRLSKENIRELYDVEAKKYLWKHGRTTHRKDDAWRLWLAQVMLTKIKEVNKSHKRAANHLDLFAGTGLSYLSQAKVFSLNNIHVHSLLLDYSPGMLNILKSETVPEIEKAGYAFFIQPDIDESEKVNIRKKYPRTFEVCRGDAADMIWKQDDFNPEEKFIKLQRDYFDVVSIMFGIGGGSLDMAISASKEILNVLKEKGRFALTDMHQPIEELAGRWGFPFPMEFRWPWFEREVYERVTVPYVFNRLWGWHDPTLYPHLMKLVVINNEGIWYGWEEIFFEIESQSWDFGLPVMPTFKQVVTKVAISEQEARQRIFILNMIIDNMNLKETIH